MTELTQILLTSSLTLLGGCLLYLFTHILHELLINPFIEYKKVLGEISYTLIYGANVYTNPPKEDAHQNFIEVTDRVRRLSASLRAAYTSLPAKWVFRLFRMIPSPKTIHEAGGKLIRISNAGAVEDKVLIFDDMNEVGHLLGIDVGRDPKKPFKRHSRT